MNDATSTEMMERKIRHTREKLETTVDELERRFSPSGAQQLFEQGLALAEHELESRLRAAVHRSQDSVTRVGGRARKLMRTRPLTTLFAGAALGLFLASVKNDRQTTMNRQQIKENDNDKA